MKRILNILFLLIFLVSFNTGYAVNQDTEPNINEQLGKKIPLDLTFTDEYGNKVALKDIFTNSTVLAFVYYKCPGICSPLMTEIANVVNKVDLQPGVDYNIITISMDERETPEIARDKKKDFIKIIDKNLPNSAWRFLTGDSVNIHKATEAAGFHFVRKGNQFLHTTAVIFVSKDGKICRYLYPSYSKKGEFSILPFDFKMANLETVKGKTIPTVGKILQFCFSYDPKGKTYVFDLLKVFGAGTIFLVLIFVVFVVVKPKKVKTR